MSLSTASTSATASAAVGSSMMRTSGSNETARPMAMLCRWPPERFSTLSRVLGMRMPRCASIRGRPGVHLALVHQRHAEHAPQRLAAEQKVARDVHRVAEREVLIDHLDPLAPGVRGRSEADFLAVENNPAGIRNDGAGQDLAQRRLSRSVVADEAEDLAGAQDEIDAIERLDRAERLADVLHLTRIGASSLNIAWFRFRCKESRESGTPSGFPRQGGSRRST